jgi:hypothetical protein
MAIDERTEFGRPNDAGGGDLDSLSLLRLYARTISGPNPKTSFVERGRSRGVRQPGHASLTPRLGTPTLGPLGAPSRGELALLLVEPVEVFQAGRLRRLERRGWHAGLIPANALDGDLSSRVVLHGVEQSKAQEISAG